MRDRFQDIIGRLCGAVVAFLLLAFIAQCGRAVYNSLNDEPAARPSEWKER